MKKKLYLCNGLNPSPNCKKCPSGCYLNGGDCHYTSDEKYARNKETGFNDFVDCGEYSIEKESNIAYIAEKYAEIPLFSYYTNRDMM